MGSSFKTALFRFGIITDIHFSVEGETAMASELRASLDGWHREHVDVLMQLGDLVNGSEAHKEDEFREVNAILHEFSGTMHHVLGNHCLALPRQELLTAFGLSAPFYAFVVAGFRFLVLDGMDVSVLHVPETGHDEKMLGLFMADPALHDYCGAVGLRQKEWLRKELEGAERRGEKVIVVCHFPLLPETTDDKYGFLWNHLEIVELLSAFSAVKVCLSGHYHHGGYECCNGIHFVVLPAFVNRWEHPRFCSGTVELYAGGLVIQNQHHDVFLECDFS